MRELDRMLLEIVCRMKFELKSNIHKGDFLTWEPSIDDLLREIKHHVSKLEEDLRDGGDGKEFAADISNYMIKVFQGKFHEPN